MWVNHLLLLILQYSCVQPIACMYGPHFRQSRAWIKLVWLPRSAVQEICCFSSRSSRLRICPRETGSAFLSRASPLVVHTEVVSGTYSRNSSCFLQRRPQIYLQPTAIGPALSIYQVMQLRADGVLRHRANSHQGSSSMGYYLFRKPD